MLEIFNIAIVTVVAFEGLNTGHSFHQSAGPCLLYCFLTNSCVCHRCAQGAKPEEWAQESITLPTHTRPELSLALGVLVKWLI